MMLFKRYGDRLPSVYNDKYLACRAYWMLVVIDLYKGQFIFLLIGHDPCQNLKEFINW